MTRVFIFFLWLLHWLPLPLQALIGNGVGWVLYHLARRRRHIALTNVRLCFPQLSPAECSQRVRAHFQFLMRSFLERGLVWWASPQRLRRLVRLEGLEHVQGADRKTATPVILLVPHFLGIDVGGTRLCLELDMLTMYSPQRPQAIDDLIRHGRGRFGTQLLLTRQDGIRSTVKAIRDKRAFYYLPDMDYGISDAVFAPFFGVPAATITGLSRLSKLTGARVHECVTEMLPGGAGYVARIGPAWENFPTEDAEADTRRMNVAIERQVERLPTQYYWVHKRFKTRPAGEKGFY